jgi:predicted nuclease of predicted toxin-antitoxin system
MIRFYMDEHVPGPITRGLRRRRVNLLTAQEDGAEGWADPLLLDRATELDRVLFTRDEDLLREAAEKQERGQAFVGVIYAHQEAVSIRQCIEDLELIAMCGRPDEFANLVRYIPLR